MGIDFNTNLLIGATVRITLTNNFHNTSVNLVLKSSLPSKYQVKRAYKALCGDKNCQCCDTMGMSGYQEHVEIVGQEYSTIGLVPGFALRG